VCFVVHKTISKQEHAILTTLYLTGTKNTDSWRATKGDLQCAFPLDVPMVASSALTIATDSERLSCGSFCLSKSICFGSFKFIADYFSGLTFSPSGDVSDPNVMGPSVVGHHDGELYQGVPHGLRWRRKDRPPLS
jgi:hypothetical protein